MLIFTTALQLWYYLQDQLASSTRAAEPSQKWHSSGSGALLFMNMAPALELFFHGSSSSSGFCLFSYINIIIALVFLNLNRKWINSSTQN